MVSEVDKQELERLWADWLKGTGGLSNPAAMKRHPAYTALVAMGESILPLVFQELQQGQMRIRCDMLLRGITGYTPQIAEEDYGKVAVIGNWWLNWGRRRGYVAPENTE